MATPFTTITSFIRAAVLDMDDTIHIYSDNALISQIRWEVNLRNASPFAANDPCFYVAEDGNSQEFTSDLTPTQKSILALRCAVRLISGRPDYFVYRTPVMSVARKGQSLMLLMDLEAALGDVLGGRFAIVSDTDFDALIQSYNRFVNQLNAGIFAWPGTPDGLMQSEM